MDFRKAGLLETEYGAICMELGREPNETELKIFGVMWSEHCSYKSSRPLLRLFPKEGPAVLKGVGENAGVDGAAETRIRNSGYNGTDPGDGRAVQ